MILVDIYIPSVDETYDFMLDENTDADKIIMEICEMISKKMNNKSKTEHDEFLLYHKKTGKMVERGRTLAESGVKDGSGLILV